MAGTRLLSSRGSSERTAGNQDGNEAGETTQAVLERGVAHATPSATTPAVLLRYGDLPDRRVWSSAFGVSGMGIGQGPATSLSPAKEVCKRKRRATHPSIRDTGC